MTQTPDDLRAAAIDSSRVPALELLPRSRTPAAASTLMHQSRDDLGADPVNVIAASCALLEGVPNKLVPSVKITLFDRCRGERRQLLNNLKDAGCHQF